MPDTIPRNVERATRAAADLAACGAWAATLGRHLVIEAHVTRHFAFSPVHFPPGTLDLRDDDAVLAARDDPTAVLVTAGGHWWGMPVNTHPHWGELRQRDGTWAILVVSMLSGAYYGLHVDGGHRERFVNGLHVRPVAVEAMLELVDGRTARIVRTNVDFEVQVDGEPLQRRGRFSDALEAVSRPVIRIDAVAHDASALAVALEAARLLPDRSVIINGTVWTRTAALRPEKG